MGEVKNEDYLKVVINNLSQEIPYQWRVQSFSKNKPQATCVAYISARDAINLLNTHATYGWHRRHYTVGDNTYCEVGLVMPDGTIQWRADCGVESQADKEKGESSDSFKRSCVNFGIGEFLYKLGMETVPANEVKTSSNYPHVVDEQGKRVWDVTKYINDRKFQSKKTKQQPTPEVKPSAIQPNKAMDTPKNDNRKDKAKTAFASLDQSQVLRYLLKDSGLEKKYATVNEFIDGEEIDNVLGIYEKVKKFKK